MQTLNRLRTLQISSAALALAGIGISLYLLDTKLNRLSILCTPGSECDAVNSSSYSVLFGVPVSAIGAVGYFAILALTLWALWARDHAPTWLSNARLALASGGLFFAAYLTGIEAFILHAY